MCCGIIEKLTDSVSKFDIGFLVHSGIMGMCMKYKYRRGWTPFPYEALQSTTGWAKWAVTGKEIPVMEMGRSSTIHHLGNLNGLN